MYIYIRVATIYIYVSPDRDIRCNSDVKTVALRKGAETIARLARFDSSSRRVDRSITRYREYYLAKYSFPLLASRLRSYVPIISDYSISSLVRSREILH